MFNVLFHVLYADDTCIYISGSDINAIFDVLNIELAALLEWLNANKLTLNVDKTFYMPFHRRRIKTDNLKLTIGQGTLKQTSQCKYLGLIIDNKLNWAAHIAHVKSKISKCVGIRAGDWVGYPIYYCKTQSLGGSFTMYDPNLWAQLNYASTQTLWGWVH